MTWSYRLATIRGIAVKVHATFALLVLLVALSWAPTGLGGIAFGLALMLLLFACVTLHEFGHAIAAQRFGLRVHEIVLLPIGGVAVLGGSTRNAVHELVIAAAGPAVNVAILALLAPALWLAGEPVGGPRSLLDPSGAVPSVATALHWLFGANVGLVLFNLVPAFPLDGGRILRALLALALPWSRATHWAARVGQSLAAVAGVWSVLNGQPMLGLVAVFVFFAAASQQVEEQAHSVLTNRDTATVTRRDVISVTDTDRLDVVITHLLTTPHSDFAVVRGDDVVGVVRRADVVRALVAGSASSPVTQAMTPVAHVSATAPLAHTVAHLRDSGVAVAVVHDDNRVVGLVSLDDIAAATVLLGLTRASAPATWAQVASARRASATAS